ncbi:MAG: helix-turn-helix domain-containing protein [Rhodospirillales bacterium]|nr:helix-turn-helix domain-containing protein [Rhodospirillales bacterium]
MNGKKFKKWRKARKLSQKDLADLLGLKPRMIQYYEKGEREGKSVKIPKSVRLACYALDLGIVDYDGEKSRTAKID